MSRSEEQSVTQIQPFFLKRYPRYCEINSYLKHQEKVHPDIARVEEIGKSLQGRPIFMLVLQKSKEKPKNAVMVEGGIHAREWLSHATVMYLIYYLLNHTNMLNYMDYYIIPCLNPDGYEYSHICKRLWRKNMNANDTVHAKNWGVDLNRNFSYGYGLLPGSSPEMSSYKYRGPHCFSEPESRCLAQVLHNYASCVKLYLAVHAHGGMILYPWGFTKESICDEPELVTCAHSALTAMKYAFGDSDYKVGCLSTSLYHSSGGSSDYARGAHNVKFAYTFELPKGGKHEFNPPPEDIPRVAYEAVAGIKAMVKHVHQYYLFRKKSKEAITEKNIPPPIKRHRYAVPKNKYSSYAKEEVAVEYRAL